MSPDFYKKWAHIVEDVDKNKIPLKFIKKLVVKIEGRKQQTFNIERMSKQGYESEEIEDIVNSRLEELDDTVIGIEFVLNVQRIAETVQPETDKLLNKL